MIQDLSFLGNEAERLFEGVLKGLGNRGSVPIPLFPLFPASTGLFLLVYEWI